MKDFWKSIKEWTKKRKRILLYAMIFLAVVSATYALQKPATPKEVPYKEFVQLVESKKVDTVSITLSSPTFVFEKKGKDNEKKIFKTDNPKDVAFKKYLLEHDVKVVEIDVNKNYVVKDTIAFLLRIIIMVIIFKIVFDMFSKNSTLGSSVGKKKEEKDASIPTTKFDMIAGNEETKEEMYYLVDFLKNPKKYAKMGAKMPNGVVLYGPPGTGKTLMAKAIAGEAQVPFYSATGSDFVEMYVGLGAKRVRDLFKKARKETPCIVFIDEIDAVATKRGKDNNSEKDQTINALLNELDGFNGTEGVIVIVATNRIEDLDKAFIRPGRFDKHIAINLPEQKDRLAILKIYTENKNLATDVNLEELAKLTIGFAGAGLEALINEATIVAVTKNHLEVTQEDIDDAYFKTVMKGHKKKNQKGRNEKELELVAWHEAGHALVAKVLAKKDVPKVTITSSTSGAGGVTFITPKKMGLHSKEELLNDIKIAYAGRVAEFLLLGNEKDITTGASQDIIQATQSIRNYIDYYGMGQEFGMLSVSALNESPYSSLLDNERFMKEATDMSKRLYMETLQFVKENVHLLKNIAESLLEKESLTEDELEAIVTASTEPSLPIDKVNKEFDNE